MAAGHDVTSRTKYGFDYFDNGAPISAQARDLYKSLGATVADFGDPFQTDRTGLLLPLAVGPASGSHQAELAAFEHFSEYFRGEAVHDRAVFPGVGREAGLEARLAQELLRAPLPLGRHLRKEQAPVPSLLDDEAVQPDRQRAGRARGSMRSSGPSTETSSVNAGSSVAVTGGKRVSSLAASAAQRATSPARSPARSIVPRHPRSSSRELQRDEHAGRRWQIGQPDRRPSAAGHPRGDRAARHVDERSGAARQSASNVPITAAT